jgi:polyphosphate kinase 2
MAKSNAGATRAPARSAGAAGKSSKRATKPGRRGKPDKPSKRAKPDAAARSRTAGKPGKSAKPGKTARAAQPAPPRAPLSAKEYDRELRKLHVELVKLQQWVVHKGLKVCIVFEGRDGAGKGGTIKAITERVSPRVFRVIALPAPSSRERSQMYAQRYIPYLPAAGEIVIFDRSWYNRAGVERVMGFCTEDQARGFLKVVPSFERLMIDSGIILLKYWLEVSPEEQTRRLQSRIEDGRKIWKLSPMDVKSYDKWDEYTRVRDEMFVATDTSAAPWFVARSESKRGVRLNIIKHLLSRVPYDVVPAEKVKLPKRKIGKYKEPSPPFKFIPEPY